MANAARSASGAGERAFGLLEIMISMVLMMTAAIGALG